jgi:hypothetical protein
MHSTKAKRHCSQDVRYLQGCSQVERRCNKSGHFLERRGRRGYQLKTMGVQETIQSGRIIIVFKLNRCTIPSNITRDFTPCDAQIARCTILGLPSVVYPELCVSIFLSSNQRAIQQQERRDALLCHSVMLLIWVAHIVFTIFPAQLPCN